MSHIFPKSLTPRMPSRGERIFRLEVGTTRRPTPIQDGWKEYLLCGKCEQRIGRWEKVACEQLRRQRGVTATARVVPYGGRILLPRGVGGASETLVHVQGCDYASLRLFVLSVLWRMGRSSLRELARVDLGETRDDIEGMLRTGNPGSPMDYPCWIYILLSQGKPTWELMTTPLPLTYKGYPAVQMAFGGFGWVFVIARDVMCDTMRKLVINRTGRMRLVLVDAGSLKWLMEGIRRIAEHGDWTQQVHTRRAGRVQRRQRMRRPNAAR